MAPIPDGYGLLVHEFSTPNAAGSMVVTEGVQVDGIPTEENVDFIRASFQTNVVSKLSNQVEYPRTVLYVGDVGGGSLVVESNTEAGGGGQSGPLPATQVAILVRKVTGLGGRKNRGRMYLPGMGADMYGQVNFVGPTILTNIQTGLNAYLDDLTDTPNSGVLVPVILHADESSPTAVLSYQAQARIATQRGRVRD